jgi:hypothetical protein
MPIKDLRSVTSGTGAGNNNMKPIGRPKRLLARIRPGSRYLRTCDDQASSKRDCTKRAFEFEAGRLPDSELRHILKEGDTRSMSFWRAGTNSGGQRVSHELSVVFGGCKLNREEKQPRKGSKNTKNNRETHE